MSSERRDVINKGNGEKKDIKVILNSRTVPRESTENY